VTDEVQITSYFLGELSNEEAERLETACFRDNAFAETIFLVEDDLIDRYVRDELTPRDRERFNQFYLTTAARRSKVEVARALNHGLLSAPPVRPAQIRAPTESTDRRGLFVGITHSHPLLAYALASVLLASAILGLWLLLRNSNRGPVTQKTNAPSEIASAQKNQPGAPGASATPGIESTSNSRSTEQGSSRVPSAPAAAVFTLHAGAVRDDGVEEQVLKLGPQTETVELHFVLQNQANGPYDMQIETAEGNVVMTRRSVKPVSLNKQQVLTLRARASVFAPRDYIGRIFDKNGKPEASYVFRVAKQK
jgi:hypothetical protein